MEHVKTRLTLKALLEMTPYFGEVDYLRLAAKHLFLNHVKNHPKVKNLLFGEESSSSKVEVNESIVGFPTKKELENTNFDFGHFAILFVCKAICGLKGEFGFHELLDRDLIDSELQGIYNSRAWTDVGLVFYVSAFKELLRDRSSGESFKDFMDDDGEKWGRKLSNFYQSELAVLRDFPIFSSSPDVIKRDLNVLMMKVHLLNPNLVEITFNLIHKMVPDLDLEFLSFPYLGDHLDWILIKSQVGEAIMKPSIPSNVSKFSLFDIEEFYGVQVFEFITTEAKELGLWTGKYPNNHRISTITDRCTVS